MLIDCLAVAAGGGLGAVGRYLLGLIPMGVDFPLMTLLVNVLGAVAIGFFADLGTAHVLDGRQILLLKTGLCGGFTTFSTFSLESVTLLQQGRWGAAGLYMGASAALCLAGVLAGRALARAIL